MLGSINALCESKCKWRYPPGVVTRRGTPRIFHDGAAIMLEIASVAGGKQQSASRSSQLRNMDGTSEAATIVHPFDAGVMQHLMSCKQTLGLSVLHANHQHSCRDCNPTCTQSLSCLRVPDRRQQHCQSSTALKTTFSRRRRADSRGALRKRSHVF